MASFIVDSNGVDIECLVAGPEDGPVLLMIHENRGLTPYMLEVVEALAAEGYRVVAPDLLSRLGRTERFAHDPESVTTRQIPEAIHLDDLCAVFDAALPDVVFGFCFGAEMAWSLVARRTARAAALFYGIGPDDVSTIATPVFAVYAQDDPRVNDTVPALCAKLIASTVDYRLESFPGTKHAFHDHHRPERYDARAATAAWREALEFLRERAG